MTIEYTPEDVLRIAIRAETHAAAFYRAAAEKHPKDHDLLADLAGMEEGHKALFERMCSELEQQDRTLAAEDELQYLGSYFEAVIPPMQGEGSTSADVLSGQEELPDILRTAIEMEKTSILLYTGLRQRVPYGPAREAVDKVISEEGRHVGVLRSLLTTAS
ncbi:MAG: ferritin-like domain-containing protein [Lentisphaerae bacterium]|nr:ferritin-like domain-containing protein [Lentisphaerota bacterium]